LHVLLSEQAVLSSEVVSLHEDGGVFLLHLAHLLPEREDGRTVITLLGVEFILQATHLGPRLLGFFGHRCERRVEG